jgi:alpha-L-rhamnosidase
MFPIGIPPTQPLSDLDPRGPIVSILNGRPMRVVVAPGRVESPKFKFDPLAIPQYPGHARWIWLDAGHLSGPQPIAALFRKEIDLPATPTSADFWFSADAHARIYINGRLVARGPDDGGQDYPGQQTHRWFVNYRSLTPYFRRGHNVIAAEVFNADAMEGRYNTTGHGGLLLEARFNLPNRRTVTVATDNLWRGIPGKEWKFANWNPNEGALQFDASAENTGWRTSAFSDSKWPTCELATTGWPALVQSEIPQRLEAVYPAQQILSKSPDVSVSSHQITFKADGSAQVVFDRVLSGFVGIKVRGKEGTLLAIQPNEPRAPGYHRMATVLLRDGDQTLELPFYDSFSVINLVAKNVGSPLELLDVRANFVSQPVEYKGNFECSDPDLNRIWSSCRWLTEICQQTHHLDSPHHQEPICDPGDYLIISLNNDYAFAQPDLARQDLRKYAWLLRTTHYKPFHTSYALLWLQMLVANYEYTGDATLIRELAPDVHALLDQFATYLGKNGIISEAPDYMFMDWVTIGGFATHHPPAVIGQGYMTAFYYHALADGAEVARLTQEPDRAARYDRMRQTIKLAYNRELWDEKAGLYLDGKPFVTHVKPGDWLPADTDIKTHSTQNNALAVLYDLAPRDRQAAIMRSLMSGDLNTQPYFMHFVFGALNHAGLFNEFAASQMRRWKVEPDTQSFREMWGTGDYSHAWECTPLIQMSARVLGVTPKTPGFDTIEIAPQPCDLTWANGIVPTPHGNVEISWTRPESAFKITVVVPKGAVATLKLPAQTTASQVTLDNYPSESYSLTLSPGRHQATLIVPTRH